MLGAASAPPTSLMNSRRLIVDRRGSRRHLSGPSLHQKRPEQSALGQKQTFAMHQPMSALLPYSDRKSGLRQTIMSALPPKADMCGAVAHVGFGPEADIPLFDDVVGAPDECVRDVEAE